MRLLCDEGEHSCLVRQLRAIQREHWKRLRAICREFKAQGAKENVALEVAVKSRRCWRNSDRLLKMVLAIANSDRRVVPRLS